MFKPVVLRLPYAYDTDEVSLETGLFCEDDSLAVQSEAEDCDINVIVARFGLTGQLPQGVRIPSYGDFVGVSDYQSALHAIMEADASFYEMPAEVRSRFNNDPAAFVEFCSDAANLEEMRKLGLAVPEEPVIPASPEPVKGD